MGLVWFHFFLVMVILHLDQRDLLVVYLGLVTWVAQMALVTWVVLMALVAWVALMEVEFLALAMLYKIENFGAFDWLFQMGLVWVHFFLVMGTWVEQMALVAWVEHFFEIDRGLVRKFVLLLLEEVL